MRGVYLTVAVIDDRRPIMDLLADRMTPIDDIIVIDSMQAPMPRIPAPCLSPSSFAATIPLAAVIRVDRRGNARWRRYKARHGIFSRGFYDACARATLTMGKVASLWSEGL